jgi:aminoglycoside 3-N-acetyltransferase I
MTYRYTQLQHTNLSTFRELLDLFSEAFDDTAHYQDHPPSDTHLTDFLANPAHIVLVALEEDKHLAGGLVAYELTKFEQAKKEIFVYDIAVGTTYQRQGVATHLFKHLKQIAKVRGAALIFVQAIAGEEHALGFYRSFADTEVVAHQFEVQVSER